MTISLTQGLEIAARMLGSDRSRRYCLEMICADFLAGARLHLENEQEILFLGLRRIFHLLPSGQQRQFLSGAQPSRIAKTFAMAKLKNDVRRRRLCTCEYERLRREILQRDGWRCQACSSRTNLQVHHLTYRAQGGSDREENLISLCADCHRQVHEAAAAI